MSDSRTRSGTTHRAFTLIEITIVLVVVGVVFAIATPRFSRAGSQRRVDMAMERIERDFRLAEQDAWHTGTSRELVFDVANNSYEIVGMTDGMGNPYIVDLSRAPYNLSINSVDFAGDTRLTIDGRGGIPIGGSVVLADGSYSATGTVAARKTDSMTMVVSDKVVDMYQSTASVSAAAGSGAAK
ncbi:MAG: prepilin-type N-terminal cleavage/methylation domain-containing protein [Planctomycetota bacterium]|nr:prepilin-type N-terminal cleavage/methylation domain-containing protein [Planctomycetota bacterium]